MDHFGNGRLQSEIAAVPAHTGVVSETLGVAAKTKGVIGLVEVAGADDELGLVVALRR